LVGYSEVNCSFISFLSVYFIICCLCLNLHRFEVAFIIILQNPVQLLINDLL